MGVPKNEGRSLSPFGCQFSAAAPLLPDGSPSSAAVVQLASDVRCSRLLKTTLTARNAPRDVKDALALGARDYLTKPFKDAVLLARVTRLLRPRPLGGNPPPGDDDLLI